MPRKRPNRSITLSSGLWKELERRKEKFDIPVSRQIERAFKKLKKMEVDGI